VAITLQQIVEETRNWPPEMIGELLSHLTEDLHVSEPEVKSAWQSELARRVQEIEEGKVQGVPGDDISARVRRVIGR
jgi:putative addiction module component (TIGR02574 family)